MHELLRLSGYIDIWPQHNVTMVLYVSIFLSKAFIIIWLLEDEISAKLWKKITCTWSNLYRKWTRTRNEHMRCTGRTWSHVDTLAIIYLSVEKQMDVGISVTYVPEVKLKNSRTWLELWVWTYPQVQILVMLYRLCARSAVIQRTFLELVPYRTSWNPFLRENWW